ncbi:MAG: allantoate deiminase [Halanaerobium sp. 4-GBenrich]|jgi:allantoate deiminase|uniref:M20 family metallo-hydrolase n=1 Tax=Halanaerobium TaxID=2330 RepID=UPI00086B3197|nr:MULTISPECIES: M20 family metallo-hydrolase [Halanaerobium]ODS49842.1 MAG: allantoate deiminase [Halanaerobium sp. 4-GBenrich]OEG63553.1 MAG: Zn-dependent hydrolase [Halanaerobium sp. MDAL1]PUU88827.1 MAG: allantoate deiminase [Halanaerobium sp.]SDH70055.1 allantoate deiminase [Halanaerobium congolense]SDK71154.1 allantoate deiminase [Halanaerobium congolense]
MLTKVERIKNDIENLSQFNVTPGQGLTRFSLTEEDRGARNYLKNELQKLNVDIYEDAAGSLVARREGTDKEAPVVMIGSHFDSVKNGGNFDGPAGVIMALEILRVMDENDIKTKYPIEFVAMIEEEGGRFGGGVFGSRAMTGQVDYQELLDFKDDDGISMAEAFEKFGFDPKKIKEAERDPKKLKAFIELHIEQGPVLENEAKDVGIVDFIVGINQIRVKVAGRADHAGTTPMDMRKDALSSAAEVISEIKNFALEAGSGTVATVGNLDVKPGAANIVPAEVEFSVDIRSKDLNCIKNVRAQIDQALSDIEAKYAVDYSVKEMLMVEPVELSTEIFNIFKKESKKLDLNDKEMISGAGHDAMIMAAITDVGLIFVPSKDGRSHTPEEWTDYEDLQKGIELVYHTVLKVGEAE